MRPRTRSLLTALNGTTGTGLLVAALSRTRIVRGPDGILIAENFTGRFPPATCFTVGSVIVTRRSAAWLLHPDRRALLGHESRHAAQYAALGPLFWPAYWACCGWSYALTGNYGARNAFERRAGLAAGGYAERPLRPRLRRAAATWSRRPPGGTPTPG